MPDWTSVPQTLLVVEVVKIMEWFFVGCVFTEQVRTASFDWGLISGKRARRWPHIFYFGGKISYWMYIASGVPTIYASSQINCQAWMIALEIFMGLIAVNCSVILGLRTICLYEGSVRRAVGTFVLFGALAVTATWMAGSVDVVASWVPNGGQAWQDGACNFVSVSPKYSIKYITTVAYDAVILALTIYGVLRLNARSRLTKLLVYQNITYFSLVAATNLVVAILCLLQLSPVMSLVGALPTSGVSILISSRVFVELIEEAAESVDQTDTQLSTITHSKGKFSMFDKPSTTTSRAARSQTTGYSSGTAIRSNPHCDDAFSSLQTVNDKCPVSDANESSDDIAFNHAATVPYTHSARGANVVNVTRSFEVRTERLPPSHYDPDDQRTSEQA